MSIKIMSMVWDVGPKDKSETLVLLALADFCNDDGQCWPSISTIANKSRMTERGLQKVIARLVEAGWIAIDYRKGRSGSNLYTIKNPEPRSPRTTFTPNSVPENPEHGSENPEPRSPKPLEPSTEPSLFGEAPPKKTRKKKSLVPMPDGWVPNDQNISDALKKNFSQQEIEHEADQFRNHHTAKGSTFKDWDAAWRTWIGNARKFSANRGMAGQSAANRYGQGGSIASVVARRRLNGEV